MNDNDDGHSFESSYRTETGKDFTAVVLKSKGVKVLLANIKGNIKPDFNASAQWQLSRTKQ